MKSLIEKTKKLLGYKAPGRQVAVFPDDTFLVSYPKSGNTWTRFLIANLLHPERAAEFANLNTIIPGVDVVSHRELKRHPRPRILKSHHYFDPRYPKVIYIVRDPRDVALSQYHFHRKRHVMGDEVSMEKFVSRFLAGKVGSYGSWGENVASWLAPRYGRPGFLLLRYEDMVEDTPRELAKIASLLGIAASMERLTKAAELSSVDRMRKLEKSQAQLFSATKGTRQDIPFVRAASSGGWKAGLPAPCVAEIEASWGNLMQWLGYELSSSKNAESADTDLIASVLPTRAS
jgi:hypothetical protein